MIIVHRSHSKSLKLMSSSSWKSGSCSKQQLSRSSLKSSWCIGSVGGVLTICSLKVMPLQLFQLWSMQGNCFLSSSVMWVLMILALSIRMVRPLASLQRRYRFIIMFLGMHFFLLRSAYRVLTRCLLMNCSICVNYSFISTFSFSCFGFFGWLDSTGVCNFLLKLAAFFDLGGANPHSLSPASPKLSSGLVLQARRGFLGLIRANSYSRAMVLA